MKKLAILFLLCCASLSTLASSSCTVIGFQLPANGKAVLHYADDMYTDKAVVFKNPSQQDTLIYRRLQLPQNTILRSGYALVKDGELTVTNDYLLRLSNDTVILKLGENYKLITCNSNAVVINDVIKLSDLFTDSNIKLPAGETYEDLHNRLKATYLYNSQTIDKLRLQGTFNEQSIAILNRFALADYYNQLFMAALNHKHLESGDEEAATFISQAADLQKLHCIVTLDAWVSYIRFRLAKAGISNDNEEQVFDYAIRAGWNKDITLGFLIRRMDLHNQKSGAAFENYYNRLRHYAGTSYGVQMDSIGRIYFPVIKNMQQVYLADKNGRKHSLKQLTAGSRHKVTLIDFWASWCIPCRMEAPLFEASKLKYQHKGIKFLSISLDNDDKISAWINALRQDKLARASNHYKLLTPKTSVLFQSLKISSIPRYIIVDNNGKVLESNFARPSEKDYQTQLARYLPKQ